MDGSDDTIEMSALGRPFQLGMLYDCRKETLIPGISLWDLDTLRKDVDTKPQSKTEFQIIASDTIDAKASALKVTASLKASFFCGLVEASLAHLTPAQKYVFDSVLSIFGKDIKDNIQVLVTFADGQTPPVLEAIKTGDLPCAKGAQGNPAHFTFNNSALFTSNIGAVEGSGDFFVMFWKIRAQSMKTFFSSLNKLESKSLTLTKEVLREQKKLDMAVEGLKPQIRAQVVKLEELRKTEQILEQHKGEMEANKDFEYEVEVTVPVQEDISGTGNYIMNCQQCHYTCHCPYPISDDAEKIKCKVMDKNTGHCTVCPGKCHWKVHFNQKYKWSYEARKEKRTFAELKEKYEKASGEVLSTGNLIEKLKEEYAGGEQLLLELIERSSHSLQRLKEIALKPNPLSTPDYINLLIVSEQRELKPGYQERIKLLKEMREVAAENLVIDVQDSEPKKEKEKVAKEQPIWMSQSTVEEASSAVDPNAEIPKTDANVKESVTDNEVIKTFLIHESKSSSGTRHVPPLAQSKCHESESDTSESEEDTKHVKPGKVVGSDLEQEEQETVDPTVMVSGQPHLYSEVSENPELVSFMTGEEREAYIKVGQEMFQSVFE
ncbi:hypothetical protein Y1Q_0006875 [Alligator mississippiensis]|uniref:Transcription factor TFIIE alpha subunit C-terminal domain-containing protein n=1 Tax=Alligator mississippiensis TaxID=8496 RepID=A0A151PK70_ALLMI|nr:hypothetical protein Y1Q_0006875 [Alligator mississippiensis]